MESSSSNTSTVFNKIVIPVITTVLGATAIYFLGFNKKASSGRTDMEQMLISKEATLKGWKSFVTAQNVSYKNQLSVTDEYTQKIGTVTGGAQPDYEKLVPVWQDFENELLRESKKLKQDIEDILKDKDIDRDFISMLNRGLDNGKDLEKKVGTFFDNIIALAKSDRSQQEKGEKLQAEIQKFQEIGKRMDERVTNEAEAIAKTLAERYNQAFNLNDLQVYVDYKKEKDKKPDDAVVKNNPNGPAPIDPNSGGGNEIKNNPPSDNGGSFASIYSNDHPNNTVEPTKALLTGTWTMTGGELELSADGEMFWTFGTRGYTSGDWKLEDGKLKMNATNPDTRKTSVLVGYLSDFTRNSFTITFMTSPKEVYHLRRSNDD